MNRLEAPFQKIIKIMILDQDLPPRLILLSQSVQTKKPELLSNEPSLLTLQMTKDNVQISLNDFSSSQG